MRIATNGIVLLSSLAICATMFGCASIEDRKYEICQKYRTSQAWAEYDHCSEEHYTSDYRRGWKAGYFDVLTGGDGCPPLVAPQRYWHPPALVDDCDTGRQDWYVGFQDGAACAKTVPDSHYLKLWTPTTAPRFSTVSSGLPVLVPPAPDHNDDHDHDHIHAAPAQPAADGSHDSVDQFPLPGADGTAKPEPTDDADAASGQEPTKRRYDDDPEAKDLPVPDLELPNPGTDVPEAEPAAEAVPQPTTLLDFLSEDSVPEAATPEPKTTGRMLQSLIQRSVFSRERHIADGNASIPRLYAADGESSLLPSPVSEDETESSEDGLLRELLSEGDPWLTSIEN